MKLSVEGYKSIASKQTIRFDGLTIMAGANSSGKSSFMQPFLILKQTIENPYDSGFLELYGDNAKLTDSSQIISKVPGYKKKEFSVEMQVKRTTCAISYRYKKKSGLVVDFVSMVKKGEDKELTLRIGMKSKTIERKVPEEDFKFIKEFYRDKKLTPKWEVIRNKCFISAELSFEGKEFAPLRAGIEPTSKLEGFVTRLIHVPGLRGSPERRYNMAISENIYPGSFEKYVASIISIWSNSIEYKNKYDELNEQLNELGLAKMVKASKVDDTSVEIQISRSKNSEENDCVNIADVGFGVSQTIPVLVALIVAKKGQHVYIEQPELHLHPKAQFQLAFVIVKAINRGVMVILETHSSILIRGLQIAVVKKELDFKSVSLNWFTQNNETGETEVFQADLDELGAFGDWPEDFDDTNLNVEQMYLDFVEKALSE